VKEEIESVVRDLWNNHRSSSLGILLGVVLAILVLIFGFWNMLFVILCAALGLYLGKRMDEGDNVIARIFEYLKNKFEERMIHESQRRKRSDI